jgi:hypothetical protein
MGHVREYTPKEVKEIFTELGFEIEELNFRELLRKPKIFRRICASLFPRLRPFQQLLLRKIGDTDPKLCE